MEPISSPLLTVSRPENIKRGKSTHSVLSTLLPIVLHLHCKSCCHDLSFSYIQPLFSRT
ncbi:unnamed protein product [Amoebophrya sp. A120]|nr:unnamed protein product [Amoebophrya sp. A120]|eukprot:GSA120T00020654001.1